MTDAAVLPGTPVTDDELRALGFVPLQLQFAAAPVPLATDTGCLRTTVGDVPDSPGLYAFTVAAGDRQHMTYVGRTVHLWMVTKGVLPRGVGSRPGQRYGRPKYAGVTRQRVNILVASERALGREVRHWVWPLDEELLRLEEETLIMKWRLRATGWNRG